MPDNTTKPSAEKQYGFQPEIMKAATGKVVRFLITAYRMLAGTLIDPGSGTISALVLSISEVHPNSLAWLARQSEPWL